MLNVVVVRESTNKQYVVAKICDVNKINEAEGNYPACFDVIQDFYITEEAAAAKNITMNSSLEDVKAAVEYDIINPNTTKVETLP